MAVSKRTRYEVLRRDNHTCRYCGAAAPDATLTVDHVLPVALGGTDDPTNLVAACSDCNAGKSSTVPDAPLVADVDADQLRWRAAIKRAQEQVAATESGIDAQFETFKARWNAWDERDRFLGANAPEKFRYWLADGMTTEALCECIDIAWSARGVRPSYTFSYLCGVVRNKIEELHAVARQLIEAEQEAV